MKHFFILFSLMLSALCCQAQITAPVETEEKTEGGVDPKYLRGAIAEIDGHVALIRRAALPVNADTADLWAKLQVWVDRCMNDKRILQHVDIESGEHEIRRSIIQRLTFSRTFISLDQSDMSFLFTARLEADSLTLTMSHITYQYRENDKLQRWTGDNTISDRVALNKRGTKLIWGYKKFRTTTIDLMDEYFTSLCNTLWLK